MLESLHKNVAGVMLAAALCGCSSLAPTYVRPEQPIASRYFKLSEVNAGLDVARLSRLDFFPDPRLQSLIASALVNNRDLQIAALNIEEARHQYGITAADALPNVNGQFDRNRIHTASDRSSPRETASGDSYSVGLQMTAFELDFFGRIRSLKNAALASYLALKRRGNQPG